MNENDIFDAMIEAVRDSDETAIGQFKQELSTGKIKFEIKQDEEAFQPDPDDNYVELDRELELLLNGEIVYEWQDIHYGYYGGMGAGWFVEQDESTLDFDIEEMLEVFEIELPKAVVPKPDELE